MISLNQIVATIKNIYSGGITKVDFPFRDAQIAFIVDYVRANLVKLDIDSKGFIDNSNIQDLGCNTLTKIDAADCSLVDFGTDIKVLEIPTTVQLRKINAIEFFGSVDKTTIIPFIDPDIAGYNKHIRFPKKMGITASQIGNKIYVRGANAVNLCYVNVRGVFEQASTINTYDANGVATCYNWDDEYPIGQHLLSSFVAPNGQVMAGLFERVLNEEMKLGISRDEIMQNDKQVNPV